MHSNRMLTAHSLLYGVSVQGSLYGGLCRGEPPGKNIRPETETPWKENWTRDRDPLEEAWGQRAETHPEGKWDQSARQEVTSYRDPLFPRGQNDRCEEQHYLAPNFICGQ